MRAAILTDTSKCIGCGECVLACKEVNNLGYDIPRRWDSDDGLSAKNWTSVLDEPDNKYVRKQCRHCLEPACVSACPVGAMHKTELGPVVYDTSKCIGCRYCMMACPFGVPRYEWSSAVPYVRKCILCYETRLQHGQQPACTEVCPTKATIFGDRDQLLAEAHRRLREDPGKYVNRVWGEHEVGGTSVLYISDIDLSFLTYGEHFSDKPLPQTTRAAMEAVPFAFVGMGAAMTGLYWIIGRRMKLQAENAAAKTDKEGEPEE
jgi:formate dehydrogenase iron-sulfur subunit